MKNLLRVLFLGSLMLSVASCELFSPKEWAEYNRGRELRNGNYNCYDKRPHCIRDLSGEIVECSEKPY